MRMRQYSVQCETNCGTRCVREGHKQRSREQIGHEYLFGPLIGRRNAPFTKKFSGGRTFD